MRGHYRPPIGSWPQESNGHVTLKGQGRDPIIFEVPCLHNDAR